METLYIVTGNKGKLAEVKSVIPYVEQLDIDLPEIQEINPKKVIEAKLLEASKHYGGEFIVEDTSLYFDCLNGLPGPLIKWFAKSLGNDGLYGLAEKYGDFGAEAKTMIGFMEKSGDIHYFEGTLCGEIVPPNGSSGFGWDPIFKPDGYPVSLAELDPAEKNEISMRRTALDALNDYLCSKNE